MSGRLSAKDRGDALRARIDATAAVIDAVLADAGEFEATVARGGIGWDDLGAPFLLTTEVRR